MDEITTYKYIIAIVLAWGVAHLIKYFIARTRGRGGSLKEHLFMSGGMPSSHSAVVSVIAVLVGLEQGLNSAPFAIAVGLVLVVIYDASHVRYMAGMTADAVNRLRDSHELGQLRSLPVYRGHTVLEVAAGAALGIGMAIVVFFATK